MAYPGTAVWECGKHDAIGVGGLGCPACSTEKVALTPQEWMEAAIAECPDCGETYCHERIAEHFAKALTTRALP